MKTQPPLLSRSAAALLAAFSFAALPLSIRAQAAAQPGAAASSAATDPVIELSPFNVDASKDTGYYTENTLAGSR
ncbi:MAG: hypothetical protein ABIZ49_10495, partial [Opitutaceae bacterium]